MVALDARMQAPRQCGRPRALAGRVDEPAARPRHSRHSRSGKPVGTRGSSGISRRNRNRWRIRLESQLANLPLLARCDRRALRRIAQWADLVEVAADEVLVRENHGDFWFFVVLKGEVRFTRKKETIATVGPGASFGEKAIVGLRPQQSTATTVGPATLLVIGARYFLSLLATSPAFQRALFPDVEPAGYTDFAKQMRAKGAAEWKQLPPLPRSKSAGPAAAVAAAAATATAAPPTGAGWLTRPTAPPRQERAPGRTLSRREAISVLSHIPSTEPPAPPPARIKAPAWLWFTFGGLAVALVAAMLFMYHPPRAVVAAGRPVDVVHDIHIAGAPVHQPHGRYLMLWVHVTRPNLAGYLAAAVHGRKTVSVPSDHPTHADQVAAEQHGRREYLDSQRIAIARAEQNAGIDPARVAITIRDRGFTGPSAGLVYSLAITDLLTGRDLTRGRTVAATGALEQDGKIDEVGWVPVKVGGAVGAGATVLLVPADQQSDAYRTAAAAATAVYGVSNFRQALDALAR